MTALITPSTPDEVRSLPDFASPETLADAIGSPVADWARQCHGVSIAIVKAGVIPGGARVARGGCQGVIGQHSWVVAGPDCYDPDATIVDASLWSYDDTAPKVLIGRRSDWLTPAGDLRYQPQGDRSIWDYGRPAAPTGDIIVVPPPAGGWSPSAETFLSALGPLDLDGWRQLIRGPMRGWPAAEIISAIADSELATYVPIDILGMNTDRNPHGLYLAQHP